MMNILMSLHMLLALLEKSRLMVTVSLIILQMNLLHYPKYQNLRLKEIAQVSKPKVKLN